MSKLSETRSRSVRALALALLIIASPVAGQDQPQCAGGTTVANEAINCPDLFAWKKFIEVVKQGPGTACAAAFLGFATDTDTFQCPPAPQRSCLNPPFGTGCPVWPETGGSCPFSPGLFTQRSVRSPQRALLTLGSPQKLPEHDCANYYAQNNLEIVFRNRAAFDYILEHGLWNVEDVEAQFEKGFIYNFPSDAIELKTNWMPLSMLPGSPDRFFQMTKSDGTTYGLVAMHISSKALPNWFWATFEHVDNWGRCDFLGCHDSFGSVPPDIASHEKDLCRRYPEGTLTPALVNMMNQAGLKPVFQNYRLKGSMTDFTTPTGSPNLLGNAVTEAGFVQTASCMTCHARATVQATVGQNGLSLSVFDPNSQSYYGTPNPDWFYSGNNPLRRFFVQTDFVWAIPFKANSQHPSTLCCCCVANGGSSTKCCPPDVPNCCSSLGPACPSQ